MDDIDNENADRGSREQIEMLIERNSIADTDEKTDNNERIITHIDALEERHLNDRESS